MEIDKNYLRTLKKRGRQSRVYRKFQLLGLEIAHILQDEKHKSLYIKLAKEDLPEEMLRLAKEVAERKGVRNKGAYFMRLLSEKRIENRRGNK